MDMSAAYVKGVAENCRNAKVVFDKFHLLQYVGKAVNLPNASTNRRRQRQLLIDKADGDDG